MDVIRSSGALVFLGAATSALSWERNRHGAIAVAQLNGLRGDLSFRGGTTQLFKTREIWGVASIMFIPDDDDEGEFRVPRKSFEEYFTESVNSYVKLAKAIDYGRARVEAGMVNLSGCYLGLSENNRLGDGC